MHWHGPKPLDYESMRDTANISNPVSFKSISILYALGMIWCGMTGMVW